MIAIFKKEFKGLFHSPLAYIYLAVSTLIVGFFFWLYNLNGGYPSFNYCLGAMWPRLLTVALLPLLTMRTFSEDMHNKSDQMLLTAPVKLWQIALGKFLAVAAVLGIFCLICCIFPLIIMLKGDYYYLPADYLIILMYFLYGCVFIAIGVFLSSITEYTAISAVLSFISVAVIVIYSAIYTEIPTTGSGMMIGCLIVVALVALLLYGVTKNSLAAFILGIIGVVAVIVTYNVNDSALSTIYDAVLTRLDFSAGVTEIISSQLLCLDSIILYLTTIALFVTLTVQGLHKRRWN